MTAEHHPTDIKLHQKSKLLEITFDSGENFMLPCEYLRTHAKSAEIETSDIPVAGKADVNIEKIEQQGTYALRLYFDDGYNTGIFSWDTLFDLGKNHDEYWQKYLYDLEKHNLKRQAGEKPEGGKIKITVLYFMTNLLKVTRRESEELEVPETIDTVEKLMKLLSVRGDDWKKFFAEQGALQFTVNRQFAETFTKLENGDEVGFVPTSKDI